MKPIKDTEPMKNKPFVLVVVALCCILPIRGTFAQRHEVNHSCGETFPCYQELKPRIEFWKSVFSQHGDDAAIFHDIEHPERVYSVLQTQASCTSRKEPLTIRRERSRIENILLSLSKKNIREDALSEEERQIAGLFQSPSKSELVEASRRIRCQEGNRHRFVKALARYQYYKNQVVETLKQNKLPEEIQYLPFVESSYNPLAYSKVGAAGLWQIMPSTARTLGLKLNAYVDERLDPQKSTNAAAKYFKQSFAILGQQIEKQNYVSQASQLGPLVITSYNYGIGGMKKAISQFGPDYMNILQRYKSRSFQTAVKNFYASFLAASEVAQNHTSFFGDIQAYRPPQSFEFIVPRAISVPKFASHFNYDVQELKELNPSFSRRIWKGTFALPSGYLINVPETHHNISTLKSSILALNQDEIEVKVDQYRVESGDTACQIARSFRVSCAELIQANDLNRRGLIRVGQILMIPGTSSTSSKVVASTIKAMPSRQTKIQPVIKASPDTKSAESVKAKPNEIPAQPASPENEPKQLAQAFGANENLFVEEHAQNRKKIYSIYVENEETLGHYADWLSIGWATSIRKINGMSLHDDIVVGQKIKLPIQNEQQKEKFEEERVRYHLTIEEGFKEKFHIVGHTTYQVQRRDTYWTIAKKLQIPQWLLSRYNPDLYRNPIKIGDVLNIPELEAIEP
ncbi:MAG: LysM peptidoglycan-binding domain-containing protein [Bdellovibrionales bacterium]|nr:LysM peptidoglycan-binding domain-containing protein [Bdellovibrionales bacterium]